MPISLWARVIIASLTPTHATIAYAVVSNAGRFSSSCTNQVAANLIRTSPAIPPRTTTINCPPSMPPKSSRGESGRPRARATAASIESIAKARSAKAILPTVGPKPLPATFFHRPYEYSYFLSQTVP